MKKEIITPQQALVLLKNKKLSVNHYATEHFAWMELFTDCGASVPSIDDLTYALYLLQTMEIYRLKLFNNASIIITGGFRDWKHHVAIYEVINARRKKAGLKPLSIPMSSVHLILKDIKGKAIDFKVMGYDHQTVYDKLDRVHYGGLEIRTDGLHADNRPDIWRGNDNGQTLKSNYNLAEHNVVFGKK